MRGGTTSCTPLLGLKRFIHRPGFSVVLWTAAVPSLRSSTHTLNTSPLPAVSFFEVDVKHVKLPPRLATWIVFGLVCASQFQRLSLTLINFCLNSKQTYSLSLLYWHSGSSLFGWHLCGTHFLPIWCRWYPLWHSKWKCTLAPFTPNWSMRSVLRSFCVGTASKSFNTNRVKWKTETSH